LFSDFSEFGGRKGVVASWIRGFFVVGCFSCLVLANVVFAGVFLDAIFQHHAVLHNPPSCMSGEFGFILIVG